MIGSQKGVKMLTKYFHPKNWKINKSVIWLKIVQALWSLGVMIIYPFINLQMASLGLNTEDISLVNGLIPLAIMITTPIAGRQLS